MFFGASRAAEKYFKIERTGQAFYILGSVFLSLTILAAGYFGLLGPEFILKGENRYRVLLAGSIATEIALFSKIRRFHNKVYTQACLWGMTVSMCFLMGALKLEWPDCMNGMMYYSFLLIGGNEVYRRKSGLQGSMNAPADRFIDEFMGCCFCLWENPIQNQISVTNVTAVMTDSIYNRTGLYFIMKT